MSVVGTAAPHREKRSDPRPPRQTFNSARMAGSGGVQCLMEGGTGLAPHPTDCTKFLNCWQVSALRCTARPSQPRHRHTALISPCSRQGKPHIQSCGPGTVFNPRFSVCDYPHKVPGCGNKDKASQPSGYSPQGGYNQFGNQGYQPPPRQPKPTVVPDQIPAASSFNGFTPNQVSLGVLWQAGWSDWPLV
jgi:hypothetical protein